MARPIQDIVVRKAVKDTGYDSHYIDSVPTYVGTVYEGLNKIKLNPSEFGLGKATITQKLDNIFQSINIKDDICQISLEAADGSEKVVQVSNTELKLLKTLTIEQISVNTDYSQVVATVFYQMFRCLLAKRAIHFVESESFTKLQKVVFKEVTVYVKKKLNLIKEA